MKSLLYIAVLLCVLTGTGPSLRAQMAAPPPMPDYQPLSDAQLDQLLGPIALYPDPLIAQILPASTVPTQIVLADRYVSGGGDPNQIDQQSWDPSVQALVRYPNILKWLDENLNWTTELGQAFLYQQRNVMESIQRLRHSALNMGNLRSTPQQQVIDDGGYIELVPAEPQVIYVPVYQPAEVYYQTCYGPPFITFDIGWPIGIWLNFDFDWWHHHIIVWNHDHPRPPDWWHAPHHDHDTGHIPVWHTHNHPGAGGTGNRGDRGWGIPHSQPVVATVGRSTSDSAAPRHTPAPAARPDAPATRALTPATRPAPDPGEHVQSSSRSESSDAFIGIRSSSDTRTYSNRGQQSMQSATHSAPASRPSTSSGSSHSSGSSGSHSSGGGGGGHSSGSQSKH